MRVRCLARELTNELRDATSASAMFRPRYQITEDREYLVLGISFLVNSEVYGNCCLFTIQDDATRCVMLPGALFEITDSRASSADDLGSEVKVRGWGALRRVIRAVRRLPARASRCASPRLSPCSPARRGQTN